MKIKTRKEFLKWAKSRAAGRHYLEGAEFDYLESPDNRFIDMEARNIFRKGKLPKVFNEEGCYCSTMGDPSPLLEMVNSCSLVWGRILPYSGDSSPMPMVPVVLTGAVRKDIGWSFECSRLVFQGKIVFPDD